MEKRNLKNYEISYLLLIGLIIIQIFLIFVDVHTTQKFSIESFTVIIIELISILLSYFIGLVPASIFAITYIIGYIVYVVFGENSITLTSYILMFFVPLSTIYAGNMNRIRKKMINDLAKLNELEKIQLKVDPYTQLENETAFKENLSRHRNLAYRYPSYYFSLYMFRIEFIDTIRTLLEPEEFHSLIENIAKIIQNTIREEDYKFIVSNSRFVLITPLTSAKAITAAVHRILAEVRTLSIRNTDGEEVEIVLKAGGLDYSEENDEMFRDYKKILLELQKATEVNIYGEYAN